MKPIALSILLICASCASSANIEPELTITLMRINSYTETCQGLIEQQCLLVQEGSAIDTDRWNYFYSEIEGFDYVAGFLYDLEVHISARPEPVPADASSLRYVLVKVISKTAR
ncbi:MAG: hypothetical protein DA394_05135 [Candidatus Arcticimaribacter sp.]|nr:MAG: hypothetical protein DA394_05135 [Candidatus Arcticimaribacter sp.]